MDQISPVALFAFSFGVAALAGYATLLRTMNEWPTTRVASSALLNSGLFGFFITLGGYWWFEAKTTPQICALLVFVSGFAGLGGNKMLELGVELFWKVLTAIVERKQQP